MSYIKSFSFLKRTFVLLSPLFLVTLASKELAFYAPVSTLSPILGGLLGSPNSLINLEKEIKTELPYNVQSYGDLLIQKTSFSEFWIEQQNPLTSLKYGPDFKYEKLDSTPNAKKISIIQKSGNSYQIKKDSFETSELKDKGGLNLLTVFDLNIPYSDESIQITHVAPLQDLTSAKEKYYQVVDVENKHLNKTEKHQLKLTKQETHLDISIEPEKPFVRASSSNIGIDFSYLAIKSFYILWDDSPPLSPEKYFTVQSEGTQFFGDDSAYSKSKKVFLNKWKNSEDSKSSEGEDETATYEFKREQDFWKSVCSDPYSVGGFIDESLKGKPEEKQKSVTEDKEGEGETKLKKQKSSHYEFRHEVKPKPKHIGQYYYQDLKGLNDWVPSDDNTQEHPCDKLDDVTKDKFKEYAPNEQKDLSLEKVNKISKDLIPKPIFDQLNTPTPTETKYPYNKIVQSSFRAYGNTYNTENLKGEQIKEHGIHSPIFEKAVKTEHSFSITLNKQKWTKNLLEHKLLSENQNGKDIKENPDVSSVIEVHYPISYSIYDPISNYLRKYRLFLKTTLDLRYLYLQSSFSREVFRVDLSNEHSNIGTDYQGFDPFFNSDKGKPFGISGTLSFIAGLELDKEKNLKINLTAQTSGFVNTKNPSCDLRHRLYKINFNAGSSYLKDQWKCNNDPSWKYRDYNHIPSFLVISITDEPEISSFYVDNNSEVAVEHTSSEDEKGSKIETLKEFKGDLDTKKIIRVLETDDTNNGEVYFQDIAAYDDRLDKEKGEHLQLENKGWFTTSHHQYIYFYRPRQQSNKIEKLNLKDEISEVVLYINGSNNSYSSFFHSGHFNTTKTLCFTETHKLGSNQHEKECGDGSKYEYQYSDIDNTKLQPFANSQKLTIPWSEIKGKGKETPLSITFRVILNRPSPEKPEEDKNKFSNIKDKLEKLFKEDNKDPKWDEIVPFSLLAVWYSVDLWYENNTLHYVTKIRPISMVSEPISNATAHKATAAAGSAGFEISKFEFKYS